MNSWVAAREAAEFRPLLETLFKKYLEPALDFCRTSVTALVKQAAVTQAQTVCSILDGMIPKVLLAVSSVLCVHMCGMCMFI